MAEAPEPAESVEPSRSSGHLVLTLAFGLAMGANFVLTLLMGRMLSATQFGVLGLLVAIFLFCSMPGTAILVMVVRRAAVWEAEGERARIADFAHAFTRRIAIFGVVLVVITAICSPLLTRAFKLTSAIPIVTIVAALAFWLVLTVNRGVLQGLSEFNLLSTSLVLEAVLRVSLAAAFVWIWPTAEAAAIGIFASTAICWVLTFAPVRSRLGKASGDRAVSPGIREAAAVVVALAMIAAMQNADVFTAKAFLSPELAGQYVATATLGKAFFFMSLAAATAMLPAAAISRSSEDRIRVLYKSAAIVGALAVPTLLLTFAAPRLIVSLVYGADMAELARWLGPLALSSVLLAGGYLVLSYLVALERGRYVPIVVAAAVVDAAVLAGFARGSVAAIVSTVVIANVLLLIALSIEAGLEARSAPL